jgi:hypothetical protein
MADRQDRRTNYTLRRRIDELLRRVRESRQEIVERGLEAVHKDEPRPGEGGTPAAPGGEAVHKDEPRRGKGATPAAPGDRSERP